MRAKSGSDGYTLIETIVAMALFVGVLIPLVGVVGHLVLDREATTKLHALRLAQNALQQASLESYGAAESTSTDGAYLIALTVSSESGLERAFVRVFKHDQPSRSIVDLERLWLKEGPSDE